MPASEKTKIIVWTMSGGICAFPGCGMHLVLSAEGSDKSLVGEVAHIIGEKPGSARNNSQMTIEERNEFSNLMLLCNVHHKLVDDNEAAFPEASLSSIKQAHEDAVAKSLTGLDAKTKQDVATYASIIDEWAKLVHLNEWEAWTSHLATSARQPSVFKDVYDDLWKATQYLFSRKYSGRYPQFEQALINFRVVLSDLLTVFGRHISPEPIWPDHVMTEKFYSMRGAFNPNYDKDLEEYKKHVRLIHALVRELTMAANHVVNLYQQFVDYSFRQTAGNLVVTMGPYYDDESPWYYRTWKPEYEQGAHLYPGLEEFVRLRGLDTMPVDDD